MQVKPLGSDEYPDLYSIILDTEPFATDSMPTFSHFKAAMAKVEGFALYDEGQMIGAATFNNLMPLVDVFLGFSIARDYWGRWASRDVLRTLGQFAFKDLSLPRISSITIKGLAPQSDAALVKAGFRIEGVKENAACLPDGYHDVVLYGILRERCRWI